MAHTSALDTDDSAVTGLSMQWHWHSFGQLDADALYALLRLRQDVFILEQACLYPDIDGMDVQATHLLGWQRSGESRQLLAYLRCFAPGVKYPEVSLGRIVTARSMRGKGLGKALLRRAIVHAQREFPQQPVRISAQAHLQGFYAAFGFEPISAPYDEDGIVHIDMRRI